MIAKLRAALTLCFERLRLVWLYYQLSDEDQKQVLAVLRERQARRRGKR